MSIWNRENREKGETIETKVIEEENVSLGSAETIDETEKEEVENKKQTKGFRAGILTGSFGMIAILLLTTFVGNLTGVLHLNSLFAAEDSLLTDTVEKKISALEGLINLYYYDEIDEEDLQDGILKGLVEGLDDPYSAYYTEDEYETLLKETTKQYFGIGVGLTQDATTNEVKVTLVYENTPAEAAGMQEGDIITKVDGTDVSDEKLEDIIRLIQGEEATQVVLTIKREDQEFELPVERAEVVLPTVESELLDSEVGYIYISRFGANTATEFDEAVSELQNQGMKSLIIDVRDNPGGLLTAVVDILDQILPEGIVVYTEDKYGNRENKTSDAEHYLDLPIAVLINGNSASASEILAGAIRDYEYGSLIGTNTYGKGVVQQTFELSDGSAIKITTEKYFTPKGENIQGTGIAPDIELEFEFLGGENDDYSRSLDNQIQKAIEVLSEKQE